MIISMLQHNFHGFSVEISYVLSLFLLSTYCMFTLLNSLCKKFWLELDNLGGKSYQLNEQFAGRDEIRTDIVWWLRCSLYIFFFTFPCLVITKSSSSKNTVFEIINYHCFCKIVCKLFFVLDLCRKFSQKCRSEKESVLF